MKICIVFQNNYVHTGHAMALELRDRYGVQELCGYIFPNTGLLKYLAQSSLIH